MKSFKMIMVLVAMLTPFPGINAIYHDVIVQRLSPALPEGPKNYLEQVDSVCRSLSVPTALVIEIGKNESGWNWQKKGVHGDYGDLQVIPITFNYWYKRLGLAGGPTRLNYLIVGVHYLKYHYNRYGSWEKARYAYGRGHWKNPTKWTSMERKFMRKIDFSKYD